MDIVFKSRKLEKIFNSAKELKKNFPQSFDKIQMRMQVLMAAPSLEHVPKNKPERCHELTLNRKGQFAVILKEPFRLIFEPNHDPVPRKDDGGIDLEKVTAITILEVTDYH